MSRYPSRKTLVESFGEDKGVHLHRMLRSDSLCDEFESVRSWAGQCFNWPSLEDRKMYAADEILETCGVEGWCYSDIRYGLSYCNTGDSYATTLCYDSERDRFFVSCWADARERDERQGRVDE